MTTTARFMAKVNTSKNATGCWLWTGSKTSSGYGQFWNGERTIQAHWFLLPSYPPRGKEACHSCDTKLCVNPKHIFIGTHSENMKDCVVKGRLRPHNGCKAMLKVRRINYGVNNHECKLTEAQAIEAKSCSRKYGAATELAKRLGVSLTVICDIRDGKRWTHLKEPSCPPKTG